MYMLQGAFAAMILLPAAPVPKQGTTPTVKWTVTENNPDDTFYLPLVTSDAIFVTTQSGELRAYSTDDGKPLWTYKHRTTIYIQMACDGTRVLLASQNGFTAVSASEGKEVWRVAIANAAGGGQILAMPKENRTIVAGGDGVLYALDAATGKAIWSTDFVKDAPADPPDFPGGRVRFANSKARPGGLTTDGENIYLSIADQSRIVAFEAKTGKKIWSFQSKGWIYARPTVAANRVYSGSYDKHFYALDKATGKVVWETEAAGNTDSQCTADDDCVYAIDSFNALNCWSQADGKSIWRYNIKNPDGTFLRLSRPLRVKDAILLSTAVGDVRALAARDGALLWTLPMPEKLSSFGPLQTDGRDFYLSGQNHSGRNPKAMLIAIEMK